MKYDANKNPETFFFLLETRRSQPVRKSVLGLVKKRRTEYNESKKSADWIRKKRKSREDLVRRFFNAAVNKPSV